MMEKNCGNAEKTSKQDIKEQKAKQLEINKKNGKAFADERINELKNKSTNAQKEITIKTTNPNTGKSIKFRIDGIGNLDDNNQLVLEEYKSSQSAPLTKNQSVGFKWLELFGGTVVGAGKGDFTNGYQIPRGTKVDIIRPNN